MLRLSVCLRVMKEMGCTNIRMENIAIRRHGRKLLQYSCLWNESKIPKQETLKGKQHRLKQHTGCLGSTCIFTSCFPCLICLSSSYKLSSSLCSPFSQPSCKRYHTAFEFYMSVSSIRHSLVLFIFISQFLGHPLIHRKSLINAGRINK